MKEQTCRSVVFVGGGRYDGGSDRLAGDERLFDGARIEAEYGFYVVDAVSGLARFRPRATASHKPAG